MHILNIITILVIIIIIIYIFTKPEQNIYGKRPYWPLPKNIIDTHIDGSNTSQMLFDPYSFSHVSHGIIVYLILDKLNVNINFSTIIILLFAIGWELIENTPLIINKYRKNNTFRNYKGDSVVNSIGDILCAMCGFYFAYKNKKYSIIYLIISEIILSRYDISLFQMTKSLL